MTQQPGTRLGPYEIEGALGAGGMGEVYRARDTRLGRLVALKVLPADLAADPDRRERLQREARSIAAVAHPHICVLHDVGHDSGIDFLVMEYIEGETLAKRLARGVLPLDLALRHASQIAGALNEAHRAGIAHRDLKPLNIMLTKAGVKLLDFGLAKAVNRLPGVSNRGSSITGEALTEPGKVLGTVPYMAPEQLDGGAVDSRTDIFAFGAVLFEMITGRRAFDAPTQSRLIAQILEHEPPDLTTLQPLAPRSLQRLVRRCLAKDPDDRWQSAADLASQIEWILEHDLPPTASRGPSLPPGAPEDQPVPEGRPGEGTRPQGEDSSLPTFLSTPPMPSFSGKAIASLVSGLLMLPGLPVAAIVLGHLARREIRRSDGALRGSRLALTGLILGYAVFTLQMIGVVAYLNRPLQDQTAATGEPRPATPTPPAGSPLTSGTIVGSDSPADPAVEINAEDARAFELVKSGRAGDAIKIYQALLTKYPSVHRLNVRLAEVFADQNNPVMALTHLRIALIQEPENVDYRIFEAELSLRLGDVGGAQKILDTVDLTRVTNPRLLEGAAVIRIRSGDKAHAANAVRILTGMVGQYPNDHLLVYQRARGYLVMDKKSEAKRDLEKYVASAPETSPQMADAKKLLDELKGKRPWWKF